MVDQEPFPSTFLDAIHTCEEADLTRSASHLYLRIKSIIKGEKVDS